MFINSHRTVGRATLSNGQSSTPARLQRGDKYLSAGPTRRISRNDHHSVGRRSRRRDGASRKRRSTPRTNSAPPARLLLIAVRPIHSRSRAMRPALIRRPLLESIKTSHAAPRPQTCPFYLALSPTYEKNALGRAFITIKTARCCAYLKPRRVPIVYHARYSACIDYLPGHELRRTLCNTQGGMRRTAKGAFNQGNSRVSHARLMN